MTLFSVENSKSVISVLTPYENRRTPYRMSWYVLCNHLTGLAPNCLQFTGVLSPQYNVRRTSRGNRVRGISNVDGTISGMAPSPRVLLSNFNLHVEAAIGPKIWKNFRNMFPTNSTIFSTV